MRQKCFQGKSWYSFPSHLIHEFFRYHELCEYTKRLSYEVFRYCDTKNFLWKLLKICSLASNLSSPDTLWKATWFLYEKIRYCETKKIDGKTWEPPPLLYLTFSIPENFWNKERFLYGSLQHCETKVSDRKLWHNHPELEYFATRN